VDLEKIVAQWYVVSVSSGSEKQVKQRIFDQVAKQGMSEYFEDIIVPVVEVPEVRRGKNVISEKKFMPGYILIKMNMTDNAWHLVKDVAKVTGFLGSKSTPKPLSEREIQSIFSKLESETKDARISKLYEIGETVKIRGGPFDTFVGVVEEIDYQKNKLRISISIFGKSTLIELEFTEVEKN